ncbi:MAG TPA: hypothetical protein ENI81_05955, partial [Phycisphaerales bacterium]|nr:hypothetical protein [Phycisphaerales bacterium]
MKLLKQPAMRLLKFALCILILDLNVCSAADLFSSQQQKDAFLRVLSKQDERYDPAERMIRKPYSSPGYHTTLKGGYVHPTRDSLNYAVALLDSDEPERLERAEKILHRVIALQDQNPDNRTYGIWSWFMEEPLEKMSPPDWNWADFCGTQLLQVAIDHMDRLPADLQRLVRESILHACAAIKKRNVGPGYTNIAIMGAYVTLVAGEHFDNAEFADYGKARLKRFYDHTFSQGSFSEYNSPTYSIVAITELSRMLRHVKDAESRKLLDELNRFAWSHVARHFHPPTGQWAGPHSRCYATLLRDSTRAYIQRATDGKIRFMLQSEALESLNDHRIGSKCPPDMLSYFTELPEPRVEIETFAKNAPDRNDIIGTTYLHPDYTLGSVNIGDLWNQRRPLLAYWKTDEGTVAMRLRCLHDDYDYSSASIFTVQDEGDILGAVVFATDRGDTHISLDRIKNATIKAKDLRLRLEFEGATKNLNLPATAKLNTPIKITSAPVEINYQIPHATFADHPVSVQTTPTAIDLILYNGPEKKINFAE